MAPDSGVVQGSLDNYVPKHSVQLVGRAEVRGATVTYEAVVRKKGLDFAVASTGPFKISGDNEAAALKNLSDLESLNFAGGVPRDELLQDERARTRIATSFIPQGGGAGMEFDTDSTMVLYGDALSSSSVIEGLDKVEFRNGGRHTVQVDQADIEIPDIDITSYNPLNGSQEVRDLTSRLSSSSESQLYLEDGFFVWENGSQFTVTGDTELDNGLLYVDGDLVLQGGVTGKGAIICTGNVIITGHSDLSATSQVAVLAGGDLTFRGTSKGQSLFTGLLYSEGDLDIANLTLVGSALSRNDNPEESSATVQEVTMVSQPDAATFDLKIDVEQPPPFLGAGQSALDLAAHNIEIIPPDVQDYLKPDGTWNEVTPTFGVRYTSGGNTTTYATPEDAIPHLPDSAQRTLNLSKRNIVDRWLGILQALEPQSESEISLFQLNPNTLLSPYADLYVGLQRPH